jgi:hypothetical protein
MGSLNLIFNTPIKPKIFVQDGTTPISGALNKINNSLVKTFGDSGTKVLNIASLANGYVAFDAVTRQSHGFSNVVSQHPIEDGSKITDHIQNLPQVYSMDVIFSDTPVGLLGNAGAAAGLGGLSGGMTTFQGGLGPLAGLASTFTKQLSLSMQAYNVLYAIWKSKNLLTITTAWQTYRNMALINVSTPKDPGTGGKIACSIDFAEVRVIDTKKYTTPDSILEPTIDLGSVMPLFPDPIMIAQAAVYLALLITAQVQGGV